MTNDESNHVNMFRTVSDWTAKQLEVLSTFPNFTETYEGLKELLVAIDRLAAEESADVSGATSAKAAARKTLEQLAIHCSRVLKAYATFSEDLRLFNAVDFTPSQLKYVSEQVLVSRAENILAEADDAPEAAAPYGLSTELVESLRTAKNAFADQRTKTRQAVVVRVDAGDQLSDAIDEADDLLKEKLDVLMELVEINYPALYNQYLAARVIVDRAA